MHFRSKEMIIASGRKEKPIELPCRPINGFPILHSSFFFVLLNQAINSLWASIMPSIWIKLFCAPTNETMNSARVCGSCAESGRVAKKKSKRVNNTITINNSLVDGFLSLPHMRTLATACGRPDWLTTPKLIYCERAFKWRRTTSPQQRRRREGNVKTSMRSN